MATFRMKTLTDYLYEKSGRKDTNVINITLKFQGYYTTNDAIPSSRGVYAAFAEDQYGHNKYRLLYIGRAYESNNLKKRIGEHIELDHNSEKWLKHYDPKSEAIFYSYVEIDEDSIIPDVERALIYKNQPPVNDQNKDHNNIECDRLTIRCDGDKGTLLSGFVLDKEVE